MATEKLSDASASSTATSRRSADGRNIDRGGDEGAHRTSRAT
jgi:hypothetical protein